MANNRDSSKQKRARQNRAQREAREARAKAASVPADERKAKYASSTPTESTSSKKNRPERTRPERPPRLGDVPVDLETLEGNWYKKRLTVPGGRQVITGAVLTLVLTVITFVAPVPIPKEDQVPGGPKSESIFDVLGSATIPLIVAPLLIMAIATWFVLSPNRRRIWIVCSFVLALVAIPLGIPYLFPVGFLVYGVMRANKIEGPAPGSRAARAVAEREAADTTADDDDE